MGKSSSLPASMSNISTILDIGEKNPKFAVGPTISSPGPMLFRQDATDVKFVIRSPQSKDKSIDDEIKSAI